MIQEYTYTVNGLQTVASYDDKTVTDVFIPLLKKWTELYKTYNRRIIVFLSAPPGTGKTTVAQFLEYLSNQISDVQNIQAIGLDGFHYHQDYIESHTVMVNGKEVSMKSVKGSPESFDIHKLERKLECLKDVNVKWPIYDRTIHDVIENQVEVTESIVLIEGNWLLLKETGWMDLIDKCDYSVFIAAKEEDLKDRLVQRKVKGGSTQESAEQFYENSDRKNIIRLMNSHWQPDTLLNMQKDGSYVWKK